MYFTECARLAERHPDLAGAVQQVDEQLARNGADGLIRVADLASFVGIDPNQVGAVLEKLAQGKLLLADEMVECDHCRMAARRSEYQQRMAEDGEYRCTSCDRPLWDGSVRSITAYRRGEKWEEVSHPTDGPVGTDLYETALPSKPSNVALDPEAWYTHGRLAEAFNVGKDALRKRLDRYRRRNWNGWKEHDDRRPREPKYLYKLKAVTDIIEELRASSERPAK